MELEIIRFIQGMRSIFLDTFFNLITELGDKYFFILLVIIYYWLIDKKKGFKLVFVFLISSGITGLIKSIVKRPRPYMVDPNLSVIRKTTGYSLPSGHSQAVTVNALFLNLDLKKHSKTYSILLGVMVLLVGFSRLYLGQHYLTDVITGIIVGLCMYFLGSYLFIKMNNKEEIYALVLSVLAFIGLIIMLAMSLEYQKFYRIYQGTIGLIGFSVGYFIEKSYLKYDVKNSFKNQVIKLIMGLFGIGVMNLFSKFILPKENIVNDMITYLLLGLWVSLGSMYCFKRWVRNDKKEI